MVRARIRNASLLPDSELSRQLLHQPQLPHLLLTPHAQLGSNLVSTRVNLQEVLKHAARKSVANAEDRIANSPLMDRNCQIAPAAARM
jgi:hypothetical protein